MTYDTECMKRVLMQFCLQCRSWSAFVFRLQNYAILKYMSKSRQWSDKTAQIRMLSSKKLHKGPFCKLCIISNHLSHNEFIAGKMHIWATNWTFFWVFAQLTSSVEDGDSGEIHVVAGNKPTSPWPCRKQKLKPARPNIYYLTVLLMFMFFLNLFHM